MSYYSDSDNDNESVESFSSDDEQNDDKTKVKTIPVGKKVDDIGLDSENDDMAEDVGDNDDIEEDDLEDIEDDDEVDDEDDDDIDEEEDEEVVNKPVESQKVVVKKQPTQKPVTLVQDDDDDDMDEQYLQKFDTDIKSNYINDYHPECLVHNYEEISRLTVIVKDEYGIVIDPLHRTVPFLTKYEKARVLGQRSKQIETGAKPFIEVPPNVIDGYVIAEMELKQKKIPFIIKRPLPGGAFEYWNLRDLEFIAV
jgi:DNA-directed RNA polymerase subunit K/omega